jgi:hypothetical protein
LQETVRLAHASAMACALFHKDAVERFDEFVARVPEIQPADAEIEKKPDENPKEPKAVVVGEQPHVLKGELDAKSERDTVRTRSYRKVYLVSLQANQVYSIDLTSSAFDPYLRLEDPSGRRLSENSSGGGYLHARIVYPAPGDGVYRVIATTSRANATGRYELRLQQGAGFGFGFGMPGFPRMKPPIKEAPKAKEKEKKEKKENRVSPKDIEDLTSKQSQVRLAAFNNLAGGGLDHLTPQQAKNIAQYLLTAIEQTSELEDVTAKLDAFAKCRPLLLALADAAGDPEAAQKTAETIVGGVLGQPLRFAGDDDWRLACRKLLLHRALELTESGLNSGDRAADVLRDLYKEQGLAFGLDDPDFLKLTRATQVLAGVVKHVAAKAVKEAGKNLAPDDKDYLGRIDRHLQAAQFVADNDLEHMVLLQRIWIKVLPIYLGEQAPAQAQGMRQVQEDLVVQDRRLPGLLDQLRAGEENVLRIWALAHGLK